MNRNAWKQIDWSKRTSVIAKECGASVPAVSIARRQYAPETLQARMVHNPEGLGGPTNKGARDFSLKELRALKLDLCVNIGSERLSLARLKNAKGETMVTVTKTDFRHAWEAKGDALFDKE